MTDTVYFIMVSLENLSTQCSKPGQHESLLRVAATIMDVRTREAKLDGFVEPILAQVELLSRFRLAPPEEVTDALEGMPASWKELKTKLALTRSSLAPMYEAEGAAVQRDVCSFNKELSQFQMEMATGAPFDSQHTEEDAYERLQDYSRRLAEVAAKAQSLQRLERLFELEVCYPCPP